jgi:hypothetical protein
LVLSAMLKDEVAPEKKLLEKEQIEVLHLPGMDRMLAVHYNKVRVPIDVGSIDYCRIGHLVVGDYLRVKTVTTCPCCRSSD